MAILLRLQALDRLEIVLLEQLFPSLSVKFKLLSGTVPTTTSGHIDLSPNCYFCRCFVRSFELHIPNCGIVQKSTLALWQGYDSHPPLLHHAGNRLICRCEIGILPFGPMFTSVLCKRHGYCQMLTCNLMFL